MGFSENLLLDLDGTLIDEERANKQAFLDMGKRVAARYPEISAEEFADGARQRARSLWRSNPVHDNYCSRIGVGSTEGLCSRFSGEGAALLALRQFANVLRDKTWSMTLAKFGITDRRLGFLLADEFPEVRANYYCLDDETRETLQGLEEVYRLAIVTNGLVDLQREKIKRSGLDQLINIVVISGEIGVGKPDRLMFETALERLEGGASAAVMVGDSLINDVWGAQQLGIKGIWLSGGKELNNGYRADAQIERFSQLPEVLRKM